MRKVIAAIIFGLLLSSNAYGSSIWDYLEIGMTKKELSKLTNPYNAATLIYFHTDEIKPLGGYRGLGPVFGSLDCENIEYFPKHKIEILKHGKFKAHPSSPIYIFEDVTKKMKCSVVYTSKGNGTLKAVVFNKHDALIIADPAYAKRIQAEEQKRIAEEKKRKEEEEKRKAEEKKIAEEKRIAEEKAKEEEYERLEAKYRKKCKGFEIGTPEYKNCILQEIAKVEEEKRIAEEKIAQENKLTEIDPDLIPIATGSGFFVSRDGYVVTNEHVAGICELMEIKIGGKKHNLNVVTVDRVNDLGLVKGNYKHPKYLEIDIEGAELGEEIVAMGYPLGKYTGAGVKITKGVVSSLTGPGNNFSEFQIDAAIGPGSSGGPIINRSGQVVGVAYGGINKLKAIKEQKHIPENVNFAISSQTLTNFLKANKVRYTKAYRDKKLETEKVAQIGDAATVKLYCLNTEAFYIALKKAESHTDVLLDLK